MGCLWGQCSQLKPEASNLAWPRQDPNPQGAVGTEWTVFGSNDHEIVPASSTLAMWIRDERKIRSSSLEHSDFLSNGTSKARIVAAPAAVGA